MRNKLSWGKFCGKAGSHIVVSKMFPFTTKNETESVSGSFLLLSTV